MVMLVTFGIFAVIFYHFTVARGSLTPAGAGAALGIGATVTFTAGPVWLLPLFFFFLSSMLIGRFFPSHANASDDKADRPRDHVQVLCNGGVYALLAAASGPSPLLLVSMAVATADTWGSEIGKYLGQPTYDIIRLRRVPVGLSGGVSWGGTVGAVAGAALVGILGELLGIPGCFSLVAAFGTLGMLVDSVLGALLQARYRDRFTGALTDRAGVDTELVGGLRWVTNDLVNVVAIAFTCVLANLMI